LVEQGIENPRVGGSIPSPATIQVQLVLRGLQRCRPLFRFGAKIAVVTLW